jgi:hypothetical protein
MQTTLPAEFSTPYLKVRLGRSGCDEPNLITDPLVGAIAQRFKL